MKRCNVYKKYIETDPEKISDECLQRNGEYQDHEIPENFWKERKGFNGSCKHCLNKQRSAVTMSTGPVLTKDWPTDKNGRWLNYWHLIDRDIVLKDD